MPWSRRKVASELAKLELSAPQLRAAHPKEAEFWSAFARAAGSIISHANEQDAEFARVRVSFILGSLAPQPPVADDPDEMPHDDTTLPQLIDWIASRLDATGSSDCAFELNSSRDGVNEIYQFSVRRFRPN